MQGEPERIVEPTDMEYVYSTDSDWCSRCRQLPCRCPSSSRARASGAAATGWVKIRREVRRGKPTTVVWDLPVGEDEARKVLKELQRSCGAGGSWKDGQLELQGDHREKVEQLCQLRGWKSKRAGG